MARESSDPEPNNRDCQANGGCRQAALRSLLDAGSKPRRSLAASRSYDPLEKKAAQMTFADGIGNSFILGQFTVLIRLRPDNPAFACFVVFKGERLIGKQFSRPNEDDARWLERGEYADKSRWVQTSTLCQRLRGGHEIRRRGRPRKEDAERQLREALAS